MKSIFQQKFTLHINETKDAKDVEIMKQKTRIRQQSNSNFGILLGTIYKYQSLQMHI